MASTDEATALTEEHRRAQAANAAAAALLVQRMWASTVTPADLVGSYATFLEQAIRLILTRRETSAGLAAKYAARFRAAELRTSGIPRPRTGRMTFDPIGADVDLAVLSTSLRVTGYLPAARAGRLLRIDQTDPQAPPVARKVATMTKDAGRTASAAAFRHVADGGRDTLLDVVTRQDITVLGYVRVTKANPCYFCAMLASRPPDESLYQTGSFDRSDPRWSGDGKVKVHDSCACTIEPVYDVNAKAPGRGAEFYELWNRSDGTLTGFRQLYEGRAA